MLALTVFCLVYFGFVRRGCVCSVGSFQNVAEGLFNPGVAVPASVLFFFALPLLMALLFGRVFCAAVCPLGAIQELVARRPRRLPGWANEWLSLIPVVFLGLSVLLAGTGTAYLVCRKDPFIALFRFSGSLPGVAVGLSFLAVGVFVARPYWPVRVSVWCAARLDEPVELAAPAHHAGQVRRLRPVRGCLSGGCDLARHGWKRRRTVDAGGSRVGPGVPDGTGSGRSGVLGRRLPRGAAFAAARGWPAGGSPGGGGPGRKGNGGNREFPRGQAHARGA